MAVEFNTPTTAAYPTSLNRVLPIVSIVMPSTSVVGSRDLIVQWEADKASCQFKWAITGSTSLVPWTTTWASDTELTYSNVPNGTYTISVKALDLWGNESLVVTKEIDVRREIIPPTVLSPLQGDILSSASVVFRCDVPRNETGDLYHYAFQILEEISSSPLQTRYVDNRQWFDSRDGYSGFSFTAPVSEDAGGEVSFTKTLDLRKNYYWSVRISTLRAGVVTYSETTELQRFTIGTLATKIILTAQPGTVRADNVSKTVLNARAVNPLGQLDVQWTGTVNFVITTGTASFAQASVGVGFAGGVASTSLTANLANLVSLKASANKLLDGTASVQFVPNRLPDQPVWVPDINLVEINEQRAKLTISVPSDADNDLIHMRIELDIEPTFDSPDKIVAETRFSTVNWTYFDGTNEVPFPVAGVPQGVPSTWIAYDTGENLIDGKRYYCRASAWDNWQG